MGSQKERTPCRGWWTRGVVRRSPRISDAANAVAAAGGAAVQWCRVLYCSDGKRCCAVGLLRYGVLGGILRAKGVRLGGVVNLGRLSAPCARQILTMLGVYTRKAAVGVGSEKKRITSFRA
ncbi:unnamed protein product, partial [Hapterophycus canaliculatus]